MTRFLNTIPINSTIPSDGQVLTYDGINNEWKAQNSASTSSSVKISGLTLWALPTSGEVGYITANYTLAKANASMLSTAGAVGAYQGTANTITVAGQLNLYFVGGLTLMPGDKIYLSDSVSGQVTNIPPTTSGSILFKIGRVLATTGFYNPLTGGTLPCIWQPENMITL